MLTGCTNRLNEINLNVIKNDIINVISSDKVSSNTVGNGFKYYKPRDFAVLEKKDFNHILVHDSTKYYLNIDINAYHSKYNTIFKGLKVIEQKTDNDDLFSYSLVSYRRNHYFIIKKDTNYFADIRTEYENKFITKGKNINYVKVIKL